MTTPEFLLLGALLGSWVGSLRTHLKLTGIRRRVREYDDNLIESPTGDDYNHIVMEVLR